MALPEVVLGELKEKLRGKSLRIPTPLGSSENKDAQENYKNDIKTKKRVQKKDAKKQKKTVKKWLMMQKQ